MPTLRSLWRGTLVVAAVSLLAPRPAAAQGTAVVPSSDPVYADLDRLIGLGLLDSTIVGQRPLSERELARLADAAHRRADAAPSPDRTERAIVAAALARLEWRSGGASARSAAGVLRGSLTTSLTATDARRRPLLGREGQNAEATIDPLALRRLGTPAMRGQTLALVAEERAAPFDWLAFAAAARVEGMHPFDTSGTRGRSELLRATARARYRNAALTVGREQYTWAQRDGDGLFLASDAPALDAISIASDQPFRLPGFLRAAGPARGTILLADLGASVASSHSRLLAYKVSVAPVPTVEIGATFENHFGGAGARSSSPLNRLVDFLPFVDIFRRHNYSDTTRTLDVQSDKAIGADARVVLPQLGGMVVAGEWLIDDFDVNRLSAVFTNDASHSLAFLFPRVGSPAVSLELTAKHMGVITYTHATLVNGMTTGGRILGDELGPDAKAFGAVVHWQATPATMLSLDGRSAVYSDVRYFSSYVPSGDWQVYKVSSNPNELRERLIVSLLHQPTPGTMLFARAGAERIRNARYFGGRRDWVLDAGARIAR